MRGARDLIQYLCVSAGMALAVSCFLVLEGLFRYVGGVQVAIAVLVAGGLCLGVAAAVAELASRYPAAPGIRTYFKQAFGNRASLLLTFVYLFMLALVAGVEGVILARVIALAAPQQLASALPGVLLALVLAMNVAGVELSRRVQTLTTLLMIAGVFAIGANALLDAPAALGAPAAPETSLAGLGTAVALAFFLFVGFEWVTPLGRSPQAYRRSIPWAMLGAVVVLGAMYALFALAIEHSGSTGAGHSPHVAVARFALGEAGIALAIGLSVLAVFTSLNAGILGASRLVYALAREEQLPRWCARLYLRTGAPVGALSLIGALAAAAMALVVVFELQLAAAAVAAAIVSVTYGALLLATARLRRQAPATTMLFRCPIPSWGLYAGAACLVALGATAVLADPLRHLPMAIAIVALALLAFLAAPGRAARTVAATR